MLRIKRFAASLCATGVLIAGVGAAPAGAQTQNGLVNVTIGDITIQDVNVGVAAGIAATVCGVQVGPVVVLATQVDATGVQRTVCTTSGGDVILSQA
jgi:hypothetical protein